MLLAGLPWFLQAEPVSTGAEVLSDETRQVKGTVVDSNGDPLIGVGVNNETNNFGVVTDLDGKFSLQAEVGDVLSFHYIGFLTKKVTVENHGSLRIVMDEDFQNLEEVVVVGYGTTKRKISRDLSNPSVQMISAMPLHQMPCNSFREKWQVFISTAAIRIRGHRTWYSSEESDLLQEAANL